VWRVTVIHPEYYVARGRLRVTVAAAVTTRRCRVILGGQLEQCIVPFIVPDCTDVNLRYDIALYP